VPTLDDAQEWLIDAGFSLVTLAAFAAVFVLEEPAQYLGGLRRSRLPVHHRNLSRNEASGLCSERWTHLEWIMHRH
jgi:hypothetical protein